MEQNTYRYLECLVGSDFQIVDGEPNIVGWKIKNEAGSYLGEVKDLLFDPQTNAVRYLIVDLNDNGMHLDDKKVMIPIGIAHLHTNDDEVVLPNVHQEQFNALPPYKAGEIGSETEVMVRDVIGSPAALRMEETAVEFDQEQFYSHDHFDSKHFYQRGGNPDRSLRQNTIHEMVQNAEYHHLNSSSDTENNHGEHTTKPWLAPGAGHNQGGTENRNPDKGQLDSDSRL